MNRKPSRLALTGMSLLCAAILVACSSGTPSIRFISIAPTTSEIFVAPPAASGVKSRAHGAAVRPSNARVIKAQDATAAVCGSQQYAATAFFSNGTSQDVSSTATWSSSSTSVASISTSGNATGSALGTTNIGATLNGITATTVPLLVDQLNSIAITGPTTASQGATVNYTASGNFTLSDNTTMQTIDLTGSSQVTWNSSNTTVATVSGGVVTTLTQGTTQISVTTCTGQASNAITLTVGAPAPVSLAITPGSPSIATGTTVQLNAMEMWSDGSMHLPANPVTWQAPTTAPIAASVVGSGNFAGLVSGLSAGSSTITATETTTTFAGTATVTVTAAAANFAYVANAAGGTSNAGSVNGYTVNVSGATLTSLGSSFDGHSPQRLAIHPSGDFMYSPDSNSALHFWTINSTTGAVAEQDATFTPVPAGMQGVNVTAIDPLGRFIYVIDDGSHNTPATPSLYGFTINQNANNGTGTVGGLTTISGLPITGTSVLSAPIWVLTDATGSYLYVIDNGNNTIFEYSIDPNSGALTSIGTIAAGGSPQFATIDSNGHLFVANQPASVTSFSINATNGTLTNVGTTAITGAVSNINVLADPSGKYLYVLDFGPVGSTTGGQVFAYNLNSSTGAIGTQIGTAQATGAGPLGMAIDPTGAFLAIDNNTDNTISLYTVTNGTLAPANPATVSTDMAPAFVTFYTASAGQ